MVLLIDNYDSFTYNLYQQISTLGAEVQVARNDELELAELQDLDPDQIILSPGPKTPADSGICIPLIRAMYQAKPILGICLGHQCMAQAFGREVVQAKQLLFGKTSAVKAAASPLFSDLPDSFEVARYHALVIDGAPEGFHVTSRDSSGDIMSMEHDSLPLFGLQFHPESFLMQGTGDLIIQRFLGT